MNFKGFFTAKFFKAILAIAVPVALQNIIMSAVNMVDVVMIGSLGDVSTAAVGVGNQVYYVFSIILFGVNSGSAVFLAQFWGKRDLMGLRRTMGYMLAIGAAASFVFTLGAEIVPELLLGLYSSDAEVIAAGVPYLRIVGASYLINGVAFAYAFTSRCSGNVRLPMFASIAAMLVNVVFNYILIYGKLGAPAMGVEGAAWATVLARVVEFLVLVPYIYTKKLAAAGTFKEMFRFDKDFTLRFVKTAFPVIVNESLWSIGTTQYVAIYGMLGTGVLAATQIVGTITNLFMVLGRSMSNAAAVMIGQKIGEGDNDGAKSMAGNCTLLTFIVGIVMALALYLTRAPILTMFNTSADAHGIAMSLLSLNCLVIPIKCLCAMFVVGICRSGGDTVYSCMMDVLPVWLLALPLGYLSAGAGMAVEIVFLALACEEVGKLILSLPRIFSGKWVHNVVKDVKA